jgi:hypothetical protein
MPVAHGGMRRDSMTVGYVFASGAQQAITNDPGGSNLPAPKLGPWKFVKEIADVNKSGLIVVDPKAFETKGFQIWPAPKSGILADQDVLSDKDILKS